DLALAEGALQALAEDRVLERDERGQRFDDGDLGAERVPGRGELDADDAAADDDRALRDLLELEGLVAGHDPAADLDAERARHRSGGQHDVGAGVALAVDLDGLAVDELALALDDGD